MEYVQLGLIAAGAVCTAGFIYKHFCATRRVNEARSWPTAAGKVISQQIERDDAVDCNGGYSSWYVPSVTYTYTVDGREFEGHRICFDAIARNSHRKAQNDVAPYPVGSRTLVRYKPDRPNECVLEIRAASSVYLDAALIGVCLMLLGAFLPYLAAQ